MLGTALDLGGEGVGLDAAGMHDHRNAGGDRLLDAGIGRGRGDRLHDDGVDLLGDEVLDVGDLLLLIEAGVEENEFADPGILRGGGLGFMRHLHRPGIGVDAEMAHADDPGRVLLELAGLDGRVAFGARGHTVQQIDLVGHGGRRQDGRGEQSAGDERFHQMSHSRVLPWAHVGHGHPRTPVFECSSPFAGHQKDGPARQREFLRNDFECQKTTLSSGLSIVIHVE